jgi:hypothetical protein
MKDNGKDQKQTPAGGPPVLMEEGYEARALLYEVISE